MTHLTISQLAKQAQVTVETVRYYERRGLLPEPPRRTSGYRQYSQDDLAYLQFIRRAQTLGFSLNEIAELLALRVDPATSCHDVREQGCAQTGRCRRQNPRPGGDQGSPATTHRGVQRPRTYQRLPHLRRLNNPGTLGRRNTTMTKQISLCPHCDYCPTVDITDQEVRIGEEGNLVTLTPAEWNILVQAIKAGELTEL
jgi:DNA-binding transcriptional MerR regulator